MQTGSFDLISLTMEYLCMMYDTEKVKHLIDVHDQRVTRWNLYERFRVYSVTISDARYEFYLVEKVYDHGISKMRYMLNAKSIANGVSEIG